MYILLYCGFGRWTFVLNQWTTAGTPFETNQPGKDWLQFRRGGFFFSKCPKGRRGDNQEKICEKSKVLLFFLVFLREFLCVHSLCEYDRNENNEQVVVVSIFFAFSQFFVFVSIFQIQSMVGNSKVFFLQNFFVTGLLFDFFVMFLLIVILNVEQSTKDFK